ncbi:MAG TPA: DUF2501 domain-containing protein [Dyella sp.]|uniref:DUF2501 domain-containing protein n=1 Tax=Dyella sp. TaxID=1869338 RepID=UPI002C568618|nr:DUF2501 domain-containing protein [Dyella sp.]HTV86891.1 DUF2501 domain-containing protein [Dyella sp.]
MNTTGGKCLAIGLILACGAAHAQSLGGLGSKLGGMMPGGGSMTSGSMGNVAGLMGYCIKNNYLSGSSGASGIQNQLLGKMGGHASSDPAYLSGSKGVLQSSDGKNMDLNSVGGGSSDMKSKITGKVCDTVLKQGKSFLAH